MFSVITNIYNKKTKGPTLMELFTVTEKLKKFFWQLETFDVLPVVHTSNISSCQKIFFSFSVAVNNSIKVGPLVFLLQMFVIKDSIMKRPVFVFAVISWFLKATWIHSSNTIDVF
jgi:hypothetical protein